MTDAALGAIPVATDELESPARRALRRLFQRRGAVVGLVVIATFIVLAVFAPLILPYDPIATSWSAIGNPSALKPPGKVNVGWPVMLKGAV